MPAGVSRRAAVFMNRDGVARGALRQRRRRVVSLSILTDTEYDTILVDAALVLEGVGPHNSLVGLDGHARVLLDHVRRRRDVDRIYPSSEIRTFTARPLRAEVRRTFEC